MSGDEPYDAACRPPVVVVHGTNDTSATAAPLVAALRADGRDVTVVEYGRHRASLRGRFGSGGIGPLAESQAEVLAAVAAVAAVQASSRTPYVDLIGHSQGGLHVLGCAAALPDQVAHAVLLGAPLYGVTPLGRSSAIAHAAGMRQALDWVLGPSARDMVVGSGQLPDLTRLPDGPRYLLLASRQDRLVRAKYLARAGVDDRLRVVWVQDVDPRRRVTHTSLLRDPVVLALIRTELASFTGPPRPRSGPARPPTGR